MKEILKIPKLKPVKGDTGPASLCMVLSFYGIDVDQEEIADQLVLNGNGSYKRELLRYAKSKGCFAHSHDKPVIDDLVGLLKKGIPPILSRKEGEEYLHCVVRGYDLERKLIYFNDPSDSKKNRLGYKNFKESWITNDKKTNYAISVKPKKKR